MASPTTPGKSFAEMADLINQHASVLSPTPCTVFTMLSIFWEETFYNNILQTGAGTAVGFGQAEPKEFYRFDAKGHHSDLAKKGDYLVYDLPPRNGGVLLGVLTDYQAARVSCAMVRDLFERGIKSKKSILNAYGGVGFTGTQPAHLAKAGGREAIIQGMLDCDAALVGAKTPDEKMAALKKARAFNQDAEFKKILFPNG
jgi:hypothetical protein